MPSKAFPPSKAFTKSLRLLNASDYQSVFNDAQFKASHQHLLILSRPNTTPIPGGTPRLGLVIAKKHIRLAVQRNRIKRILRETFRQHQQELGGIDAVVMARRGLDQLDNAQLHTLFCKQWGRIIKKAAQAGTVATPRESSSREPTSGRESRSDRESTSGKKPAPESRPEPGNSSTRT